MIVKLSTFDQFREDFLIFAASKQDGDSLTPVGVHWISPKEFPTIPDAWKSEVVQMLSRSGLGESINSGEDQEFCINGEGITEAEKIRAGRTNLGKAKSFGASNWMAIVALIISLFAVVKN